MKTTAPTSTFRLLIVEEGLADITGPVIAELEARFPRGRTSCPRLSLSEGWGLLRYPLSR